MANNSDDEKKQETLFILQDIGNQLRSGIYPVNYFIPGAEMFTEKFRG